MKIKNIYDFISLLVLSPNILMIYELLYKFSIELFLGLQVCLSIEHKIKKFVKIFNLDVFKRPDLAIDCGLFNDGGWVGDQSGFPSGHMTVISWFMFSLYLRSNNKKYFILYQLPCILMGISRYMKSCHNLTQIFAGYLLGILISFLSFKLKIFLIKIIKKLYN